jgi:hypothetical protein
MEQKNIRRLKNVAEELNVLSRLCEFHNSDQEVSQDEIRPLSLRLIRISDELQDINEEFYVEADSLRLMGLLLANANTRFWFLGNLMEGIAFFLDAVLNGIRIGGRAASPGPAEGFLTDVDSWPCIREENEPDYMKPKQEIDLADLDIEELAEKPA